MARKRNALGLRRVANLLFLFLFFPFLAEELLVPLALVLRDGGCPLFFRFPVVLPVPPRVGVVS